ncbi:MAG TPA: hypothetical protein VIV11_22005 [Kofleriaceae bacterium]
MRYGLVAVALIVATAAQAFGQPGEPLPSLQPTPTEPEPGQPDEPLLVSPQSIEPAPPEMAPSLVAAMRKEPPPPEVYRGSPKSPFVAGALSLGLTAAGIGLNLMAQDIAPHYDEPGKSDALRVSVVLTGTVLSLVGPTSGHIYAGQAWNPGLKWRLIGGATFAVSIVPAFAFALSDNAAGTTLFGLLAAGGGVTYIGATIWEIGSAPGAARRHNERLEEGASFSVAPIIGRESGLAIGGRF